MKPSRYYEIVGAELRIYENPYPSKSASVSICPVSDLRYYRKTFRLRKVLGS